jgi:hypothetical protein
MLTIVRLLSERHMTGTEIMRELQCSRNQFYRIKDNMRNLGINLYYDPTTNLYSLNHNTVLSENEALVLNRMNRLFLTDKDIDKIVEAMKRFRFPIIPKNIVFSKKKMIFGVISDIHAGSKFYRPDILRHAALNFKRRNVDFIINAGDSIEGINRQRPEQIFELDPINGFGITEQAEYLGREFKQFGNLKVYSAEAQGSHGGWSIREQRLDIGKFLAMNATPQYIFVGYDEPDIVVNGLTIRIRHPEQKYVVDYINGLMPNNKPHILIQGHFHDRVEYKPHRNVHAIEAGCLQSQTPFLKRRGSNPILGYWIVEVEIGDTPSTTGQTLLKNGNYVESFRPEFVQFYDQGEEMVIEEDGD